MFFKLNSCYTIDGVMELFDVKHTTKGMMGSANLRTRELTERFNMVADSNYSAQAIDYKIKNRKLKAVDFAIICDICGFEMWYRDRATDALLMALPIEKQLKFIMAAKKMTQEELRQIVTERTGKNISRSSISAKITGENVTVMELQVMADILGCDLKVYQRGTKNDGIEAIF
ncbi:Cro/C1-type HTH DNA-binding domain-containing protein [Selenomonas ruminantium]|uniref:Cro/C1-type HTH DNA-binding domain-containing protein n=1 Tax=Selenomonas ruminantium TaxID=971 RepID=A0A1I0YB05_SELRU|nr:Cro/C1-type HTH DNA-binding domain-containing protein [Selenomonas ruminantium]